MSKIPILENAMSEVKKSDCVSLQDAQDQLGVVRSTLNSYIDYLGIEKHRFRFDTKSYITKADFERVRQLKAEND